MEEDNKPNLGIEEQLHGELICLKEEYSRLQEQLSNIEYKYQSALTSFQTEKLKDGDDKGIGYYYKILSFIGNLFDKTQYSDIKILLQYGRQLNGHKLVLASRSSNWGVSNFLQADFLDLSYIEYEVAFAVIKWVYTNDVSFRDKSEDFMIELIKVAVKFDLQSLNTRCQKAILTIITQENAKKFYNLSEEISAKQIIEHCKPLIFQSPEKVEEEEDIPADEAPEPEVSFSDDHDDEDYDHLEDESDEEEEKVTHTEIKPTQKGVKRKYTRRDKLSCFYCCQQFTTNEDLEEHKEVHSGQKNPFECNLCDLKEIPSRAHLRRHLETHEKKVKRLEKARTCKICHEIFDSPALMKQHNAAVHPKTRQYVCSQCGKGFSKRTPFEIHYRVHTGERPFPCEFCGKGFNERGSLKIHLRTHTGVKPYVCDVCGKAYISSSLLKKHIKLHDPSMCFNHVCTTCGHTFTQRVHLKTHEMIHSGEKPHQCTYCGKTFTDKSSFNRHIKIHTGERPHECRICGKGFIQRVQLVKHSLVHKDVNVSANTNVSVHTNVSINANVSVNSNVNISVNSGIEIPPIPPLPMISNMMIPASLENS